MLSTMWERAGRAAEAKGSHIYHPFPLPCRPGGWELGGRVIPQEAPPHPPGDLARPWSSARPAARSCPSGGRMEPGCLPAMGMERGALALGHPTL